MRNRNRIGALIATALALCLAGAAYAELYGIGRVIPISKANDKAAMGDYFAVEGVITRTLGRRLFIVRDDSGEMKVLIPEYITRKQGMPVVSERIRVSGKYDRKKLDQSIEGMRVARLQRLGKVIGGRGEAAPDATAAIATPRPSAPPAARTGGQETGSIVPAAPEELKQQLGAARRALDAAREEVDAAATAYARALYAVGEQGHVEQAILDRLQQAESSHAEIAQSISPLVEEARKAGVSPELIKMYEDMTLGRQ